MADIRIKDLTTTASSTAADDFFAADGATNGTRKLSAYSPTFGGNATVSGNLTVNGGGTHLFGGTTRVSTANGTAATFSLLQAAQQQWAVEIPASSTNLRLRAVDAGVDALTLGTNGSATVGGALTVNSTFTSSGSSTTLTSQFANTLTGAINILNLQLRRGDSANGFSRLMWGTGATTEWSLGSRSGDTNIYLWDEVANAERLKIASSTGNVSISATTASTSTSSGALVVGNGTSGGLGVGGAIWGGGKVHVGSAGYADGGAKLNVYATPSDAGYLYGIRLSDNSTATLALGLQTPTGTTSSFIHSNIALGFGTVGTAALNINTSQQVQVLTTTASTSTSSGALVVSGGVGVAGAIVTGGIVRCGGSNGLSLGSDTGNIRIDSAGPAGVEFRGLSAADTITGFTMREMALIDGTTAPSTRAGYATIYVDTADGDLKVKFGDGTVKTIATDS
jgi:hypothetical protein